MRDCTVSVPEVIAKPTTRHPTLGSVHVKESVLLPMGHYALTKNGHVVWDSITGQPAELPMNPSRWDGVMLSTMDFLALLERKSA